MDAVKLLGSLLSSGGMGGSVGSNVLGSLLGGGGGGGAAGALSGLLGGGQQQQQGGGAAGMLGNLLGGGQQQQQEQQQQGGGIGGALGSLLGGQGGQSGGGGGLLGNVVRGALSQQGGGGGGAAGALGSLLGGGQEQQQQDPFGGMPQQEVADQATLLIRAMCNAAKSDGQVDPQEQEKILGRLGDNVGQQEIAFLKDELSQPLDLNGFLQQCPQQMAPQVYAMSVMAINVDTQEEAQYLSQLAQGLGLDGQVCNQIHEQLGAPQIFT